MINLNKILVPTDFSEFSKAPMNYGCAIAARFNSELHLLHVVPDAAMLVPEAGMVSGEAMLAQTEVLEESALQQLQELPPDGWDNGKPVIRGTRTGATFYEIIQYAREVDIDLIVIGTHGRSGLMHVLLGSVAEKIVRKAPCPVLTVRPEGHQFVMP